MSDVYQEFYELYRRVVHAELQLPTTINESYQIEFIDPELGKVYIDPQVGDAEVMDLFCVPYLGDQRTHSTEDILRVCRADRNYLELAKLFVSYGDQTSVRPDWKGWVQVKAVVYMVLALPGLFPDEALLRSVVVRAMASMKTVAKEFKDELQKLESSAPA